MFNLLGDHLVVVRSEGPTPDSNSDQSCSMPAVYSMSPESDPGFGIKTCMKTKN